MLRLIWDVIMFSIFNAKGIKSSVEILEKFGKVKNKYHLFFLGWLSIFVIKQQANCANKLIGEKYKDKFSEKMRKGVINFISRKVVDTILQFLVHFSPEMMENFITFYLAGEKIYE